MRTLTTLLCLISIITVFSGCTFLWPMNKAAPPGASVGPENESVRIEFTKGYELFEQQKHKEASICFYRYLSSHTPDDTDYEWATFFFGISLKKIGLSHATVDILSDLVKHKPNPKIVSYCLELLEKISRSLPFDRDMLIHQVICDEDYDFVEQNLSDFIHYHQGIYDWEHGFIKWGDDHFSHITPKTYYYNRYKYHKALHQVYLNQIDDAIFLLKEILSYPLEIQDFKDEVLQTLARLLYEKGEFKTAIEIYRKVETPILDQAANLMEKAWSHYRMGEYEKAMGLLYAFNAPSYINFFTPEYYILKSFIYKGVCHYQSALSVIDEFKSHYGSSLEHVYDRDDPKDNKALLMVILQKKQIKDMWMFLDLLETERSMLKKEISDTGLFQYLDQIYVLGIDKTTDEFKRRVESEYEKMANDLLKYEEESHLLEYEIGLDMYQRVQQYHYKEESDSTKADKPVQRTVAYPFQGEFWLNELDNYQVILPNKCECSEEWDVFFK